MANCSQMQDKSYTEYHRQIATGHQTDPRDFMHTQYLRLSTFVTWPSNARAAPSMLASAGFYYTGNEEEVECFACRGRINRWDWGESPLEKHRKLFPRCPYVTGCDQRNVLFKSNDTQIWTLSDVYRFLHLPVPNITPSTPASSSTSTSPHGQTRLSEDTQPPSNLPSAISISSYHQCANNDDTPPSVPSPSSRLMNHETRGSRGYTVSETSTSNSENLRTRQRQSSRPTRTPNRRSRDFRNEAERLHSFADWSCDYPVSAEELAAAGFSYTGISDRVRCAFCHGVLRNWEVGDIALDEHRHYFPNCPFIQELESNINSQPSNRNEGETPMVNATGVCLQLEEPNAPADAELGISTHQPVHGEFAVESVRLNTFRTWPSQIEQKPVVLASAGFYYTGLADNIKCFFCDGGLRNWEPGDDPWTEHARFFPRCVFLNQVKGRDFVRKIQDEETRKQKEDPKHEHQLTGNKDKKTRDTESAMSSTCVRAAIEMGYDKKMIHDVISRKIQATGTAYCNAESLVEDLLQYESEASSSQPKLPQGKGNFTSIVNMNDMVAETKDKEAACITNNDENSHAQSSDVAFNNIQGNKGKDDIAMSSLVQEIATLKENLEKDRELRTCKICMENEANILFLPCGHLVACSSCSPALRMCPICRAVVRGTVRTFFS